jgi:hypothetical protein
MMGRLQERWAYLAKLRQNPSFDEDNTDSQEVLDDVVIRVAAREYLDTLKVFSQAVAGHNVCMVQYAALLYGCGNLGKCNMLRGKGVGGWGLMFLTKI